MYFARNLKAFFIIKLIYRVRAIFILFAIQRKKVTKSISKIISQVYGNFSLEKVKLLLTNKYSLGWIQADMDFHI